jgi:hypothetical protein
MERDGAATSQGLENPAVLDLDEEPCPPELGLDMPKVNLIGVMCTVHAALYWLPRSEEPKYAKNTDGEER